MDVDDEENKLGTEEKKEDRPPTIIELYPFGAFCNFLERVSEQSKSSKKRELLEELWKLLKSKGGKHWFPLMRLLLPQLDLKRRGYGMKEKKIADLYICAIPLTKTSSHAKKLIHFKNPKYAGTQVGDFTNCLFSVLRQRCVSKTRTTLFQVNIDLNRLHFDCNSQALKTQFFQSLMRSYTACEQKWFIRIILKDLKCGVRHESVLKAFHPNSWDIYNQTSSLLKCCQVISDPNKYPTGKCLQIELFHPIKPMLASRRHWNQVTNAIKGGFGIEIKFDGERVMIHYRRSENKVMFWSRNSIDLEAKYGYVAAFGDVIKSQFQCDSCILDGEMMSFDEDLGAFIPFGSNRTVAQNKDTNNRQHLCYMAFDILMINGEITMDLTLLHRRELLKNAFKHKKCYFETTKMISNISDTAGIMRSLDEALQHHHEGIVVKALNSIYECNKRGDEWIKLKPDYVENMVSSLDLLIVGGYFGEGRRRNGDISHFLLGCRRNPFYVSDHDENENNADLPTEFYTFCKVGSGYNIGELKELQNHLREHWKTYKRSEELQHFLGWKAQPGDVPDVWIEPQKSVIVELLANEIVITKKNKFSAGLTVRFPRCKKFRYDKPWFECISLPEIKKRFSDKKNHHFGERTAAEIALLSNPNGSGQPLRKKRRLNRVSRQPPSIMHKFRPADTANIEIESDIFYNKEFCVLNALEMSEEFNKHKLEKLIVANGGILTQNPLVLSTNYLIAERITPRVNNIIKSATFNILRPIWLTQSVESKRILPFAPNFMIYSTDKTNNLLQQSFDKYGDHYMRPTNIESLKRVFTKIKMKNNNNNNNILLSDEEELSLICGWNRFKRCNIYIDYYEPINICVDRKSKFKYSSSLRIIEKRLQLYGAQISQYLDCNVTHIVVDNNDKKRPRLKAINEHISKMMNEADYKWRPHLVTKQWVIHSIRSQAVIEDYHKFAPRTLSFPQRR